MPRSDPQKQQQQQRPPFRLSPVTVDSGRASPPSRPSLRHCTRQMSLQALLLVVIALLTLGRIPERASAAPVAFSTRIMSALYDAGDRAFGGPAAEVGSVSGDGHTVAKRNDVVQGYSAVVAFGASYTDNAHPRAKQYAASLRLHYPYTLSGGRYSNGPVAVEHMVDPTIDPPLRAFGSKVELLDYAYGGSVIKNGLDGTQSIVSAPAAVAQISTYLDELGAGVVDAGLGRVLHYFNSGINVVDQLWYNAIKKDMSNAAAAFAASAVTANTDLLISSIQSIVSNANVTSKIAAADYMIVGIPPLETVPAFLSFIPSTYSATRQTQALNLLQTLTQQYNDALEAFSYQLRQQTNGTSRVFYYPLDALWRDMYAIPLKYGITKSPITHACYSGGRLCDNPSTYLYFDTLHPVTSVHRLMATRFNTLLNALV